MQQLTHFIPTLLLGAFWFTALSQFKIDSSSVPVFVWPFLIFYTLFVLWLPALEKKALQVGKKLAKSK